MAKTPKQKDVKEYVVRKLVTDRDIAVDFAQKVYQKFDKLVKAVVLFGSQAKNMGKVGSDIDLVIIIDDASIKFDTETTVWYREELAKVLDGNPYNKELHITTIKLTTWWQDLTRGDPVVVNMLRYGEPIIDIGGFFVPQKILLEQGRIKPSAEAVYTALNRIPEHLGRSRFAKMSAIEGCYWAYVDAAQSLLMVQGLLPPSPEFIPQLLTEEYVNKKRLNARYVREFRELYTVHKKIMHGEVRDLTGQIIDEWQKNAQNFFDVALKLIKETIE